MEVRRKTQIKHTDYITELLKIILHTILNEGKKDRWNYEWTVFGYSSKERKITN